MLPPILRTTASRGRETVVVPTPHESRELTQVRCEDGVAFAIRERIDLTGIRVEPVGIQDEGGRAFAYERPDEGPRVGVRRHPGTERERVGVADGGLNRVERGRRDGPLLGLLERDEDRLRQLRLHGREDRTRDPHDHVARAHALGRAGDEPHRSRHPS